MRAVTNTPPQITLQESFQNPDFVIVQIGAHEGNTGNDPIFNILHKRLPKGNGRAILVEPVKEAFETLKANYRGVPGVIFENVAISDHSGEATFYRLGVDPVAYGHPAWLSQLGSLKKERMGELWDKYERDETLKEFYLKHRVEETVQCLTFAELLKRNNVSNVDLLQIDVEGYEYEILRTIDFEKTPIRFVNYESVLLHERKPEVESLMRGFGFLLKDHGQDTFCYREADASLFR